MAQNDNFLNKDGFFFVSIGGSEQIGLNCLLYICDGQILVVDIGMGFPSEIPGVQVIVPDLSFLIRNKDRIIGLIITHIHEDHCGALPHVLKCFSGIDIYCSRFCGHFVQAKLDESGHKDKTNFIEIHDGQILKLGKKAEGSESQSGSTFEVEFVNLTHSTLEMMALVIKTRYGTTFHTGDWKLDDQPVIGQGINRDRLKAIGDRGIDVMMCDSTNAMVKGHSKPEASIQGEIERLTKEAKGRVIITMFASNVGRISTILTIAQKVNRKVCLVGRSVSRVIHAARDSGYLEEFPADLTISEVEARNYRPEELIILCTGCQAEPLAALTKIVYGRHGHIKFLESDTVLFSSKVIPGNEKRVYDLYNQICRLNAKLITQDMNPIHVSGHPARDELKEMYAMIRPKVAIPVHGEEMHLREHAKLAAELGVSRVIIANNGRVVKISKEQVAIVDEINSGFLCVDGKLFRREHDPVIKARKKIMENGVLVISIQFYKKAQENQNLLKIHKKTEGSSDDSVKINNKFRTTISIFAPGLLDEVVDKFIMSDLIRKIQEELENTIEDKDREHSFSYIALTTAKKVCKARLGKDPIIKVYINFEQ